MLKISGFDQLSRQLEEAQAALRNIDGELGTIHFSADDPASIEAAIAQVNALIDARLGPYANNPIVAPMIGDMKEKYREAIVARAAALRLEGETDADDR